MPITRRNYTDETIRRTGQRPAAGLVRDDYHGSREVPTGPRHAIPKAAGIDRP